MFTKKVADGSFCVFFLKKGTYVFHDYTQGIPVENNTSLI